MREILAWLHHIFKGVMMDLKHAHLCCQWCGFEGPSDAFDLDSKNGDGFWCPDCDGHTYYEKSRNQTRRIFLILETKDSPPPSVKKNRTLQKRLSPLRYPGGKSKLIDFLGTHLRSSQLDSFTEAFAGGASVGLSLLNAGLTKRLIINDTDPGVYSFWEQAVNDPGTILSLLDGPLPTREDFFEARKMLDEPNKWSRSDLAWSQLLVNRLSFSGISTACPLGGKNGDRDGLLSRWNPKELQRRIRKIHSMSASIDVTRERAEDLIEKSAYWDERSTLFVDPPYVAAGKRLYRQYFTEGDHKNLAWLLDSLFRGIPGADIIITYDDCPLIRSLYQNIAEIATIGRQYSI